jgi:hypothetical protein
LKTVLVIGDSLACSRSFIGLGEDEIFSSRLQQQLGTGFRVVNRAFSGNNSRMSATIGIASHVVGADASYMAVQLGIVDCAPRLMSNVERLVMGAMSRLPFTRGLAPHYARWKARYRIKFTKWFPRTEVPLAEFRRNIARLLEEAFAKNPLRAAYLVNIAWPGAYLRERSYGIDANVAAYNQALAEAAMCHDGRVRVIDVFSFTRDNPHYIVAEDGHHIYAPVHDHIANAIAGLIAADQAGG